MEKGSRCAASRQAAPSSKSAKLEIALAKAEIGADGIGCEPASAVTLAGLKKLVKQGFVKSEESVVLILTGHLLKDPEFTLKFHRGDLFAGTENEKEADILALQQRAPIVSRRDRGRRHSNLESSRRWVGNVASSVSTSCTDLIS